MTDQRDAATARRVDQLGGLAIHLLAFLAVNAVLFTQTGFQPAAGHFWGWGIGVAAHTLAVLSPGNGLKQRLVQRQLDRHPAPRE